MSSWRIFVLFLLVVFSSCCLSAISLEEDRKITAVGKLSGGSSGGGSHGGSPGGGGRGGGGGRNEGGGNEGSRTPSGTTIPAIVAGGAGAANARHGGRKHNAAAISHTQPIYIPIAAALLGVAVLLFV